MSYYKSLNRTERVFAILAMAVILIGVVLRVVVLLQNRNLIIDEANIARNLFERDFVGLTKPLSYEQYAPIFFLWVEKLSSMTLGFSEYALKIYPLLCSIGVLCVLYLVLKEYAGLRIVWYPLALIATGFFFVRYSTEVKQYMSDALVVLLVVYAALKIDIEQSGPGKFIRNWILIGTFAIFSAMPSVFALTGVGGYYVWQWWRDKKYGNIKWLIIVALVWLAEFAVYYVLVLKDQAHSDYLQQFHANYFLVATPTTAKEFAHNWNVGTELISLTTGYSLASKLFNYNLLLLGSILLLYRNTAKGLLVLLPIFFTLVAGAINEYSMIPRVVLFMMPLFLVIISYALDVLMKLKPALLKYGLAAMMLACLCMHSDIKLLWAPWYSEEISRGMQLMQDNGVSGQQVNISHGSGPAFIYYTQIHPGREHWASIKDAQIRNWDANWAQVSKDMQGRFGVVFSTIAVTDAFEYRHAMEASAKAVAIIEDSTAKCYSYVFEK